MLIIQRLVVKHLTKAEFSRRMKDLPNFTRKVAKASLINGIANFLAFMIKTTRFVRVSNPVLFVGLAVVNFGAAKVLDLIIVDRETKPPSDQPIDRPKMAA